MKKKYLLYTLFLMLGMTVEAQRVIPVLINMNTLADFEAKHPELLKTCKTCGENERDGGWRGLIDMPLPKGANIKRQFAVIDSLSLPHNPSNTYKPLTASPVPNRTFLGYVDPGQTIPPDTHGAIGPNHVVTATNDYLKVHTKTGTVLSTVSINTFTGLSYTCDPYLQFDPVTQRWYYVAIECTSQINNKVAILVSASNDPTGNWYRYSFVPILTGGPIFLDHPYLGFDDRWLVISGRKFTDANNFGGPVCFLFDKFNLTTNGTINFGTNAQVIERTVADGDAPLPVTLFGFNPNPNTFYILQNWNSSNSTIRLTSITGDIPTATWNTAAAAFPTGGSPYISAPGDIAEQIGEPRRLSTNDARISSGVMVNGKIWCAQHIGISSTNVAVQWWQLDGRTGNNFGNILQRGRIGEGIPNNYRWFPSIAVNRSEDVIIGYTVSSNTSMVSSAYSFRNNLTPLNTTLDENIYKLGLSTYFKTFGTSRARWGDYSHSAIDPSDESLWTIQEYADQRTGAGDNNSRFGVWWAQVLPTAALLQRDVGIDAVNEPVNGLLCNTLVRPKITIRNMGLDTLRTVEIAMLLDGLPLGTTTTLNNLLLTTFASSPVITLPLKFTPAAGLHELKVYTKNPNGSPDMATNNDTAMVTFTIASELQLPYLESFESIPFPPSNGSAIINENAGSVTWSRSTLAGNPGNASLMLNSFNYNKAGERDIYRTPKISVDILDSLVVNFNVAYKENINSSDSLLLLYSPDCGNTWLPTGYAKGGKTLKTSVGTATTGFIPTAAEWRSEKVVIKDFCPGNLQSIMIGFQSYNDFGNNIYVDGISITGFASSQRNIKLKTIDAPQLALCTNSIIPAVSFSNTGKDTIRSLKINYQVDGGPVSTYNWSGNLAKCNATSVILSSSITTIGTHELKVFTSEPNGLNDFITSDDTLTRTFTIYNTTPLPTPVVENFESDRFPRDGWGIQNLDGLKTWERTTSAAKTGIASLWINNPSVDNANNAIDNFLSPIIANNASLDSIFVSWDHAYKKGSEYPGSTTLPTDTFELLITRDCGNSFTSIWKKWGDDLQTENNLNNSNTTAFVPNSPTEWKSNRIYLTPIVGKDNFQVYFVSKSNKQNNIWLDNINISSKTLPQRLKNQGYLIYPNPFQNSFRVHHFLPPVGLQALQLYNAGGQLVWEQSFNGNATTEINIDLGNFAKGLYVLKMSYTQKIEVERIVKN